MGVFEGLAALNDAVEVRVEELRKEIGGTVKARSEKQRFRIHNSKNALQLRSPP